VRIYGSRLRPIVVSSHPSTPSSDVFYFILTTAVLSGQREQSGDSDADAKPVKNKSEREAQAKEIDELLKKGAYDIFRDDDDKEAEKFMETDIDQLLEKSSKKVSYGPSVTSSLGSGLGSFSKASFVANTNEGEKDVDLDDPDFWKKAIGLEAPVEIPEEVAAMIDDGVKRSRKQVQVYDPVADAAQAEKMRKERIALEKMLEREEKERLKMEKKMKKRASKEKKAKKLLEQQEQKEQKSQKKSERKAEKKAEKKAAAAAAAAAAEAIKKAVAAQAKKLVREVKPKKTKKIGRQLAVQRAENEDPPLERLKQAWEVPQRAKATAAIIRFGFARFCKIRNESNLTSLPLQDFESFVRSYVYQLALQVTVILLMRLQENPEADDLRPLFREWLGLCSPMELDWICDSIQSAMQMQLEVENYRRFLRMPIILAEPLYVQTLRQGAAFRALRRISFLVRLNQVVEDCIDSILSSLGHEEVGKRGCAVNELPSLDVDLKARYITTEELSLAISSKFHAVKIRDPASWWDRSCDIALIIGTFVHGLGNYEAMRNDFDLPFAERLRMSCYQDEACIDASNVFRTASSAGRQVFDDALEALRVKAELEVQAAVAAAAKAASKREEDAAFLRKGGAEAAAVAVNIPDTQVENAFEFDGTDSHFVTLPRIHASISESLRNEAAVSLSPSKGAVSEVKPEKVKSDGTKLDSQNGDSTSESVRDHQKLPMPDARVLDHRLLLILKEIEKVASGEELPDAEESNPDLWRKTDDILTNLQVRRMGMSRFVEDVEDRINEYSGVGLGANQCGTSHRTLNDGADYGFGGANAVLSHVAYGPDAPRYLRALCVPMNITRFAVSGLVYAETSWVRTLLETEKLRFYGDKASNAQPEENGVPKEEKYSNTPSKNDGKSSPPEKVGAAVLSEGKSENEASINDKPPSPKKEWVGSPSEGQSSAAPTETEVNEAHSEDKSSTTPPDKEESGSPSEDVSSNAPLEKYESLCPNGDQSSIAPLQKMENVSPSKDKSSTSPPTTGENGEPSKDKCSNTPPNDEMNEDKAANESNSGRDSSPNMGFDRMGEESGSGNSAPCRPKVIPVDPVSRIPEEFRENAILRANVCVAVLFYGFPSSSEDRAITVDADLWKRYPEKENGSSPGTSPPPPPPALFTDETFRDVVVSMAPDVEIPDAKALRSYVETILLPHCLNLCVNGNGPTTRNARGSQGEYETSFGVSLHPEPSEPHPSPIPDPCLILQEHSMEALGYASAILRRVRLLRSCVYICGSTAAVGKVDEVVRSKAMGSVRDMPIWWCPWVHDVALVIQSATGGLFSVIPGRSNHPVFSPPTVQRFLESSVLGPSSADNNNGGNDEVAVAAQQQRRQWTERQSRKFPSLNQLERRLAFLCSRVTADVTSEARFDCIPMFDHGGWPRN